MVAVVRRAHVSGISIQSDWFRKHSGEVSAAASLGLISTYVPGTGFGRTWRPTQAGLAYLERHA